MPKELPYKVRFGAVDNLSSKVNKIADRFPKLTKSVTRSSNAFKVFEARTAGVSKKIGSIGNKMKSFGQSATMNLTAPILAGSGLAVKAFSDYETALVGVGKTTGLQGKELAQLGEKFAGLSKKIPFSTTELLGLGQTAAQLGVTGSKNIEKFSTTMAKLSSASDVVGEEGATQLARFIQVTGGSIGNVDKFASALVGLGNSSAATEREILSFSARLGGTMAAFGVSSTNVLGMATTLKSLGINAEAGSSSMATAMGKIESSILAGGNKLKLLSRLTGISADEIEKRFKEDSVGVFQEFIGGLDKVAKNGKSVNAVLKEFGMTGVNEKRVLGLLSKNTTLLSEKMKQAGESFEKNTALQEEFDTASKTLANRLKLLTNKLVDMGRKIGVALAPIVEALGEKLGKLFDFIGDLSPTTIKFITIIGLLVAAIGPLVLAFGTILAMIPSMITGFNLLAALMAGFKVKTALMGLTFKTTMMTMLTSLKGFALSALGLLAKGFTALMGGLTALKTALIPLLIPLAKFLAIAGLIAGAGYLIYKNWQPIKGFFQDLFTSPLQQLKDMFKWIGKISGISKLFGFGQDSDPDAVDKKLRAQGFNIKQADDGARDVVKKDAQEKRTRDKKALIGVEFSNMPRGTTTSMDGDTDMLELKTGYAGAQL